MNDINTSIAYPLRVIHDVLDTTKLALVYTVRNSQSDKVKTFTSLPDVIDEMCMNVDPVASEFKLKNPTTGTVVTMQTDGINVHPTNITAFNKFMTQIAGFNVHGEMYVLNQLVESELLLAK